MLLGFVHCLRVSWQEQLTGCLGYLFPFRVCLNTLKWSGRSKLSRTPTPAEAATVVEVEEQAAVAATWQQRKQAKPLKL